MRILRVALYVLMALVLAGGWAFLYWQSSDLDLQNANVARAALNELRAIDARWNDQLAGLRLAAPGAPPKPIETPSYASVFAQLERAALQISVPPRALAGVQGAFEEKAWRKRALDALRVTDLAGCVEQGRGRSGLYLLKRKRHSSPVSI